MAIGDVAAAAGIPVVPAVADIRKGYEDINKVADALGTHILSGGHAWSKIAEKPPTFPPSDHNHTIADILAVDGVTPYATALQAQLDAIEARLNAHGI